MALKNSINEILTDIENRVSDKILEPSNAALLKKLIENTADLDEAIKIAELGTTYKKTGFHFDKRLEKEKTDTITYFKKNEKLSFETDKNALTHKLIIGDNYPALLNLLVEYKNKIGVIYIDPPYGKDSMGEFADTNYENAITRDNLLSMLYPRLVLARQLLSDTGIIFCSIDDKNQAYVKGLFDDVFGESNFIANLPTIMNLKGNQDEFAFAGTHEYTLVFAKNKSGAVFNQFILDEEKVLDEWQEDEIGYYKKGANLKATGVNAPREKRPNLFYPIYVNDNNNLSLEPRENCRKLLPITNGQEMSWRWSKEKLQNELSDVIVAGENGDTTIYKKQRPGIDNLPSAKPKTLFYKPMYSSGNGTNQLVSVIGEKLFNNPKPTELIKDLVFISSAKNAIVLDFFAGSGTTGQAVLELNKDGGGRQFILCTNNEKTDTTPNGIAYDVSSKRLKRVMTGKCYDDTNNFKWLERNKPLGDNLLVVDIETISDKAHQKGQMPFDVIDETLYGTEKLSVKDKIEWVCDNFEKTTKQSESDADYLKRKETPG